MATNNQLARAVATIVPDEALAKVDVYKEKAQGIVNSIQDQLTASGIDIGAIIRGGKSVASMLPSIVDAAGKLSKGNILERLAASSDLAKTVFSKLPPGLQANAGAYLESAQDLVVSVSGVVKLAQDTDFKNVKDLGEFVNKVYGSDLIGFTDPNSKAGLIVSLVGDCQKHGFGNVFKELTNDLKGDVLNKVAEGCLSIGIEQSDITLIKDISEKMGGGFIKNVSPNLISDFSKAFTKKETLDPVDSKGLFETIIDSYGETDEFWLIADRDMNYQDRVLDATKVRNGSPDFLELVMDNVLQPMGATILDVGQAAATTVLRHIPTPKEAIQTQFPRLVLSKGEQSNQPASAQAFPVTP